MKLFASEIKPNPFKKEINGGLLNEDQVQKLQASMTDLGAIGALQMAKGLDKAKVKL